VKARPGRLVMRQELERWPENHLPSSPPSDPMGIEPISDDLAVSRLLGGCFIRLNYGSAFLIGSSWPVLEMCHRVLDAIGVCS
jgi:hypothetical protein